MPYHVSSSLYSSASLSLFLFLRWQHNQHTPASTRTWDIKFNMRNACATPTNSNMPYSRVHSLIMQTAVHEHFALQYIAIYRHSNLSVAIATNPNWQHCLQSYALEPIKPMEMVMFLPRKCAYHSDAQWCEWQWHVALRICYGWTPTEIRLECCVCWLCLQKEIAIAFVTSYCSKNEFACIAANARTAHCIAEHKSVSLQLVQYSIWMKYFSCWWIAVGPCGCCCGLTSKQLIKQHNRLRQSKSVSVQILAPNTMK